MGGVGEGVHWRAAPLVVPPPSSGRSRRGCSRGTGQTPLSDRVASRRSRARLREIGSAAAALFGGWSAGPAFWVAAVAVTAEDLAVLAFTMSSACQRLA